MDLDHERRHLAQTNRHIAELRTHIARQRIIVQAAIHKGRPSPEGESYLEVLEDSLRTFERHRGVILRFIKNWPPQIKLIAQPDVPKLPAR
jgi:hypothetical protein